MKNNHCRFWSFLIFLLFLPLLSLCQNLDSAIQFSFIKGTLRDIQSEEPISFASVYWKFSSRGVKTDSVGNFSVSTNFVALNDTLIISSVGFITKMIPKDKITQANLGDIFLNIQLPIKEVVVASKYNRGVWFWKKIMAKKKQNDPNKLLN
ncbi:MAG: carboxypeptidase-like regulatory domain-containing protein, partial [Sediminibacterium sp.]|nr:carboxypeptidase-like regulatory domain-containing protein [Sediminibacterium sp.]